MGSASSKVAKTAATGAARRQYPQRVPQSSPQPAPGPTAHPKTQTSSSRDEVIDLDARDPDFARSLRSIGPVNPNPTLSNTSTFRPSPDTNAPMPAPSSRSRQPIFPSPSTNPALQVLAARERLAREANEELSQAGRPGHGGKQFLDVLTVKRILTLREGRNGNAGMSDGEIEKALGLKKGLAGRLGGKVFAVVD